MKQEVNVIRVRLKTPRAAAIASILFSVLLSTGLILFRLSVRASVFRADSFGALRERNRLLLPCDSDGFAK